MNKEKVYIDYETYGTKAAKYWVNCFDRELIILFNGLNDEDIKLIEKSLDESYINWQDLVDVCCEEYMIDKLHPYYKNHIVAVIYDEEEE